MNTFSILFASLFIFIGQLMFAYQEQSARIQLQSEQQGFINAGHIEYQFKIFDNEKNKNITDQDLNESHTKKLHFIVYDSALKAFNHVHPTFTLNTWTAELNLPANGNYFIWVQGELLDGTEFSSPIKIQLNNGQPENPKIPLTDIRTGLDNQTVLNLSKTQIKAGKMTMLTFKVSRSDGTTPQMAPYLGALAHVIATPTDGNELIHVHPMEGSSPNSGMLHATFPKEGAYKLWIQFIEHDELKIIPLSVIVLK